MKIIEAGYQIMDNLDYGAILRKLEMCGRVCYKSEEKITDDSAEKFVRGIIKSGHESVIEHAIFTVKFIVDRGVSHEIVRHRLASYSQESTRYCNYGKDDECTFIMPFFFDTGMGEQSNSLVFEEWKAACLRSEEAYLKLLKYGATPQEARSVLPNSLKTEVVMTANLREWRHFFRVRTSLAAHPQMREVTVPLLYELKNRLPVIFEDITFQEVKS